MTQKEFEKKWLETFAPNLTKKQYNECYISQYPWHIFSYEIIPEDKVLVGNDARKAYESAYKEDAITINLFDDKAETSIITEEQKDYKKVDKIPEFFVVDKKWRWTYVSTHENDCMGLGPYFYKIK